VKKLIIKNHLPKTKQEQDHPGEQGPPRSPSRLRTGRRSRVRARLADTVKATLTVASAVSGQTTSPTCRAATGKLLGSPTNPKGYKYRDKEVDDGTAKIVVWKPGKLLKAVLQGSGRRTSTTICSPVFRRRP